jgi:enamine deaminase RidA (YjgF/YER057c/UK114 family)
MNRERVSTGTEWEPKVGYSRAVRVGGEIHVAGTTATDEDGEIVAENDPHEQTVQALRNIESALEEVRAEMSDVVRTRLFVTDIDDWESIGEAHGEVFDDIRPATSMVEVSRLITPEALVEIEADAITEIPE